eukprot:325325-Prymnesium_polylepis.2
MTTGGHEAREEDAPNHLPAQALRPLQPFQWHDAAAPTVREEAAEGCLDPRCPTSSLACPNWGTRDLFRSASARQLASHPPGLARDKADTCACPWRTAKGAAGRRGSTDTSSNRVGRHST